MSAKTCVTCKWARPYKLGSWFVDKEDQWRYAKCGHHKGVCVATGFPDLNIGQMRRSGYRPEQCGPDAAWHEEKS